MREIEFRGRDINYDGAYGPWFYGWYIDYDIFHEIHDNQGDAHSVEPETVCQFTGQTDVNGKKIYEGDVVKSTAKYTHPHTIEPVTRIGVVRYCPTVAEFRVFESEDPDDSFGLFPCAELEVLGNIWDSEEYKEKLGPVYFAEE